MVRAVARRPRAGAFAGAIGVLLCAFTARADFFGMDGGALPPEQVDAAAAPIAVVSFDAGVPVEAPAPVEGAVAFAGVVDVSVRGNSRANAVRRSGYAVSVVDLTQARQRTADLGEILARDTAVAVQRAGALGSRGTFSLGGLGGERLRFFLDGVPLDLVGYAAGVQNVPVNLIENVEVYQGVVPGRLGADALGGAVNLVTDEKSRKNAASASYMTGDFGTHRFTAAGRYHHKPTGLMARGNVYFDRADNDYKVDVSTFDSQGRTQQARLPRFHDGYRANGFHVGAGVTDKRWAERLTLNAFRGAFDNEVQNGATMERPFGAVTFERQTWGLHAKYAIARPSKGVRLEATAGYARLDAQFRDLSNCLYDWYGRCAVRSPATLRGEINGTPQSTDQRTDTFFLRVDHLQRLSDTFRLRIALAPTFADRTGKNPLRGPGYDPLAQPRKLFTGVLAVELDMRLFDDRLTNTAFVKGYGFSSRSEALLGTGQWSDMSRTLFRAGGGDTVRVDLTSVLYAKASYEYALRQPSVDELFGDGLFLSENLGLRPERSHNANLGLQTDEWSTPAGFWRASVNGFARWSSDLIALIATDDYVRSVNIADARALGVEAAAGWTTPHVRWFSLDGRVTYQDLRNRSVTGDQTACRENERVPSIPYLMASGAARLHGDELWLPRDALELSWNTRYVHGFDRGCGSLASGAEKLGIPAQLSHSAALTYRLAERFATTIEAQNLTDADLFDFYGVQRPGRAFFAKWTVDY